MGDIAAVAPVPNGWRYWAAFSRWSRCSSHPGGADGRRRAAPGGCSAITVRAGRVPRAPLRDQVVDYVLLGALAMGGATWSLNQKYLGHLVVVLYFASTIASELIAPPPPHARLRLGPRWVWSDLNWLAPFIAGSCGSSCTGRRGAPAGGGGEPVLGAAGAGRPGARGWTLAGQRLRGPAGSRRGGVALSSPWAASSSTTRTSSTSTAIQTRPRPIGPSRAALQALRGGAAPSLVRRADAHASSTPADRAARSAERSSS